MDHAEQSLADICIYRRMHRILPLGILHNIVSNLTLASSHPMNKYVNMRLGNPRPVTGDVERK